MSPFLTGKDIACILYTIREVIIMYEVLKRDGGTREFDISKISAAMIKAFEAQGRQYHTSIINLLSLQVCADFETVSYSKGQPYHKSGNFICTFEFQLLAQFDSDDPHT